ncbi:MAG: hypothetical protein AB1592_11360 [Pseudomonadota bacterium]
MKAQEFNWKQDRADTYAQSARKGGFELVAYDLPEHVAGYPEIGWQLFIAGRRDTFVDTGTSPNLASAKAAAEQAYRHYRGALS